MTAPQRGIYIHIPWCRVRCPYCNFVVAPESDEPAPWTAFTDALIREYHQRARLLGGVPTTLGLGGGTPSRMPVTELARLIRALPAVEEVAIEANPEDVTQAWLDGAIAAGVTRISLGVQTWNPQHARTLGRAHTAPMAHAALQRIRRASLSSWSLDLMFALPGQSLDELERDLEQALAHDPPHLSLYGLTWEPGTGLDRLRRRGRLTPADDELWRQMYDHLRTRLDGHGLALYEVSNFAKPGHQSRHNRGYWTGAPYLGLGPGAHGFGADGRRWMNVADWRAYLQAEDPTLTVEHPQPDQAAADYLIGAMRWIGGASEAHLSERFGQRIASETTTRLVQLGLLHRPEPGHWALTHRGMPVADQVIERLIDALDAMQSTSGGL